MVWQRIWAWWSVYIRFTKIQWQLTYGAWRISKLPKPIITIFGGARVTQHNPYALQAHTLAHQLVINGFSVLTGGGSGIMEAASCGAITKNALKNRIMGIGVKDLSEHPNRCLGEYLQTDYFFERKWLLTRYSVGFVVFPGGFGTLDELSEVLTLIKTNNLKRVPVILVGSDYWEPLVQWITQKALQQGFIEPEHMGLFMVLDDINQIVSVVCQHCQVVDNKRGT